MKLFDSKIKSLVLVLVGLLIVALPVFAFAADDPTNAAQTQGEAVTATEDSTQATGTTEDTGADKTTFQILVAQCVTIVFLLIALVVYLIIDIVLIGRWVMIAILAVLSPIPFILMVLPATKKYAQMWWHRFIKWAFVGVFITFFLWLVPQVLGTKNDTGYWETKTVETILPPEVVAGQALITGGKTSLTPELNVIYPKFLGGNASGADFIEGFIMFLLAVGFMIAAAWVAITLGETAGKVAIGIPKFAKNTAGRAGRRVGREAWRATGVPGGVRKWWGERMAPVREKREAAVAEALGVRGARAKDFSGRVKKAGEQFKGIEPQEVLGYARSGRGPQGEGLDQYERVAAYLSGAAGIEDYTQYQQARGALSNLGAGGAQLAELENKVKESNILATYDLTNPNFDPNNPNVRIGNMEYARLENDYRNNPERFHSLLSKQREIPGGVLDMVARVGGGRAVRSLIKPYNRNNVLDEMEDQIEQSRNDHTYTISNDLRGAFAGETGRLGFAFSRKTSARATRPGLMVDEMVGFINRTTDPIELGRLNISRDAAPRVYNRLSPNQLGALNSESFDNVARVIKRDMDKLKDTYKVGELEALTPDSVKSAGYSFDLFNYIKKNKGKFNLT